MIEAKLQKKLRTAILQVSCIFVVFLICGGMLFFHLRDIQNTAVRDQLLAEAEEYKSRIYKQFESDFQVLYTLSAFIEEPRETEDWGQITQDLNAANEDNNFLSMAFYDRDMRGVICMLGEEPLTNAALSDLNPEAQKAVSLVLEGTPCVSRLFESTISQQRVCAYSIPVYAGDEIIGVLAATDHIAIFRDIISGNTVLGGGGYIHLLGSDGSFLVRSPNTIVQTNPETIYDGPYLSADSEKEVRQAMERQERIFSAFTYEGKSYPFLLEPMGLNGWYLFCVNTGEGLGAATGSSNLVIGAMFVVLLLLLLLLMARGYRLLRNYNLELRRLAYYDPLTGAENMTRFQQRLVAAMGSTGGSIAALSIRQFPFITEIFGKERANRLLIQVKETADRHLQKDEFFCRDSGDVFYLFLADTDQSTIRSRLNGLMDDLEHNAEISMIDYQLAFYCGVVPSPAGEDPEATADHMLTSVLFALDRAKGGYTSTIWFFDTELHKKEELENYIETHMHQALLDGEFRMFLQPKKDLRRGVLAGAEALVRWTTAEGKVIFPDQFIPLFERNGFCVKLDLYMVEQACRQIRSWLDRGIEPIPISVNQSKLLFFEPDYVQTLTDLTQNYGIPSHYITLEILEGLALENVNALNEKIVQLQAAGFRISLDDFGSGFSSLNTLGSLKIDELKLDRAFLLGMASQEQERVRLIMKEVVQIARALSISTVAEGVETAEDEQLIQEINCDFGQGYLYSRPISAADFDQAFMNAPS